MLTLSLIFIPRRSSTLLKSITDAEAPALKLYASIPFKPQNLSDDYVAVVAPSQKVGRNYNMWKGSQIHLG